MAIRDLTTARQRTLYASMFAFTLMSATSASAQTKSFDARYEVRAHGLRIGEMRRKLEIKRDRYRFDSHIESSGLAALLNGGRIDESSEGTIVAGSFQPLLYSHRRTGRKQRETQIIFDWNRGAIKSINGDQELQIKATHGTLDKLVYQMALSVDVANSVTYLHYLVADGGRLKSYRWQRLPGETVEIRDTPISTIKVAYDPPGSGRKTVLWLAPSYHYLPVKIEYTDDGKVTTAVLLELH
ncbi:MAG: DUF3108 domain-containing protein [Gammaproteobacteria bacterium]|nr:DUF3108 domain-containing protein [Gammaproteobacteria bacterium]